MDLLCDVGPRLFLDAGGEGIGLFQRETTVEKVECLNGRGAFAAARGALARVGAIERAKYRLAFTPDLVRVNHPAQPVLGKRFDGLEAAESAAVVEQVEAPAVHLQVQLPA